MSSDDQRVSAEDLRAHVRLVDVDGLTEWQESAWAGDVGGRAVQSAMFGNLELVLTYGDVVMHGADRVEAERFDRRDGGVVPVVDLQALGYSWGKAEAAVLSIRTHYDRDRADPHMLAELVTSLAETVPHETISAGWDGDSLDVLMAAVDDINDNDGGFLPSDQDGQPPAGRQALVVCPNCHEEFAPQVRPLEGV